MTEQSVVDDATFCRLIVEHVGKVIDIKLDRELAEKQKRIEQLEALNVEQKQQYDAKLKCFQDMMEAQEKEIRELMMTLQHEDVAKFSSGMHNELAANLHAPCLMTTSTQKKVDSVQHLSR